MKETILNDFTSEWNNRRVINLEDMLSFISNALDQVRTDTIKEVEEMLPKNKSITEDLDYKDENGMWSVNSDAYFQTGRNQVINEMRYSLNQINK